MFDSLNIRQIINRLRSGLWEQALWLLSGSGIQSVVAFAGNLALVRLLTPEDFGHFAVIQANIGLVASILNLKISDLVLRVPEEKFNDDVLSGYIGILIVQMALTALGSIGLLWMWNLLEFYSLILLFAVLASMWVNIQVRLFERKFDYQSLSVIETGSHAGGHVFAVVGAFCGLGASVLYLRRAFKVLGRLLGLQWRGVLQSIPFRLDLKRLKEVVWEVQTFWLDGMLSRVFKQLVMISVGKFAGETATGFFYQARRLATTPHQLVKPLTSRIAYNFFSHKVDADRRKGTLRRALAGETAGLGIVAVVIFLIGDPVIPLIFGSNWAPVVPMLNLMLGAVIGMTTLNTLNSYYMSLNRLKPFIATGRAGQYFGLCMAYGVFWFSPYGFASIMSVTLSASYLLGTILPYIWAEAREEV